MIQIVTDYPFIQLGDEPGKIAPRRIVEAHWYDQNKYVGIVLPDGQKTDIKAGYCYKIKLGTEKHPGVYNLPFYSTWEEFENA